MTHPKVPFGPTYEEMLDPSKVDPKIRAEALHALEHDELNPLNLFNITWRDENNQVRKIVLPKALTGIDANIVVLIGKHFPSGSHKVGPAYSTLIEGCVDGEIIPGKHTILGPSTGNFGIGVSYICNLMKYDSIVIMPDNMSKERYERIRRYGAKLDLTPGTESDVILTLERTFELKKNPANRSLAQFELLPNYRFHRHVTGYSAIDAVKGIGNGRIAAFASAIGSAGTIAAGDTIKTIFPEAKVVALEPYECSTLTNGGRGQHRIEGIGDKMVTLIHNVLTTDFIVQIEDTDTVRGLKIIHDAPQILINHGVDPQVAEAMRDLFGVSGICNILGAIKIAKYLHLGPDDNVVTVATDGFDRYDSVLQSLEKRELEIADFVLERWFKDIFLRASTDYVEDARVPSVKERLFKQKEFDWLKFGYSKAYLDSMKQMAFWDHEYNLIKDYDQKILAKRGQDL
ncbi:MAG: pyridoxal-phosphate dependent enzyme [Bacilli bacterium]|jgi:cysteine synthase|nr:pyridoxal-phosphate dependent enzyme [Bacilli bacterium]MDD3389386.1 pyridoxal-phosphate dependent enzyme [Bacilli bacterium]MDD4345083.1 pyridoxal-phosphate dependent enzyme [Bacilli bacterium]MDD4521114.1 pyridoxal-phosphate dependent enzyme [Bacilli bacterium]MDY0399875.1 pyridoxal-phosphate dependent enzyme [Bacilli bacterium]